MRFRVQVSDKNHSSSRRFCVRLVSFWFAPVALSLLLTTACSLDASLLSDLKSTIGGGGGGNGDGGGGTIGSETDPLQFTTNKVEFGHVTVGTSNSRTVTVKNYGSKTVEGLRSWKLNFPFRFVGDVFPGTGGTCSGQLASQASCTVVLSFAASAPASFQDDFEVRYEYEGADQSKSVQMIASADSGITALEVKAGTRAFCARLSNQSLKCWGNGGLGYQLGDGVSYSMDDGVTLPVTPLQMDSGVLSFDMTGSYSCALKTGGEVWCWGYFAPGAFGTLTSPTLLIGSDAVQVSIGTATAGCAVMSTGQIRCWGYNDDGIVGNGLTTGVVTTPSLVMGFMGMAVDVAVGSISACALTSTGEVYCWGSNADYGILRPANNNKYPTAAQVVGMPAGIVNIETASHSNQYCVLSEASPTSDREVHCWGQGYGTTPVKITGFSGRVSNLDHHINSSEWCVSAEDESTLYCWNSGETVAVAENFGLPGISMVEKGIFINTQCAVSEGRVYCWGANLYGALGIGGAGAEYSSLAPQTIPGLTSVTAMAMSNEGLAVESSGALWCWGLNQSGACGTGDIKGVSLPRKIFHSGVTSVATNGYNSCIARNGKGYCAGDNFGSSYVSVGSFTNLSRVTGEYHYCGVDDGAAYCWGWNDSLPLGVAACIGDCNTEPQAVTNMNLGVTSVAVGYGFSCAVKSGQVYCWGSNSDGRLGSVGGNTTTPRLIDSAFSDFVEVAAGYETACASRASGGVYCWGGWGVGPTVSVLPGTAGMVVEGLSMASYTNVYYKHAGKIYQHDKTSATEISSTWSHYGEYSIDGGIGNSYCRIVSGQIQCWGSNVKGNLGLSDPSPATKKEAPFPVFGLYE